MNFNFKKEYTLEQRKQESDRIKSKYPDRVPVIAEVNDVKTLNSLDKSKYLVPSDLTIGQLQFVLRKRIKLPANQAMFLFVGCKNTTNPSTASLLSTLYDECKDEDGFLYVTISSENTFG